MGGFTSGDQISLPFPLLGLGPIAELRSGGKIAGCPQNEASVSEAVAPSRQDSVSVVESNMVLARAEEPNTRSKASRPEQVVSMALVSANSG